MTLSTCREGSTDARDSPDPLFDPARLEAAMEEASDEELQALLDVFLALERSGSKLIAVLRETLDAAKARNSALRAGIDARVKLVKLQRNMSGLTLAVRAAPSIGTS